MPMLSDPRNRKVSQSHFAMIPRNDVPRSVFRNRSAHKTTFDAGWLVPIYLNEVLPGDTIHMRMTAFARLANLIFPLMDNLYMETFWFFVPNRLVWKNWQKFMGEQTNPSDSTDYTVPVMANATGVGNLGTLADFFGMPSVAQVGAGLMHNINALPFRGYSLIWDQWFRDENLQDSILDYADWDGDGPDNWGTAPAGPNQLRRRGKRHDYFTSCLPWPQKGSAGAIGIPLDGLAPIQGLGFSGTFSGAPALNKVVNETARGLSVNYPKAYHFADPLAVLGDATMWAQGNTAGTNVAMYADLSQATNATMEQFRQANMIQTLMERDARGGTRYTEILRSHFGVISPDARLQRPEYLGGSSSPVHINPVAQTSETATTPLGQLSGVGTGVHESGFSHSFVEHGFVFCLLSVRADLTYQQGYHRMWTRRTKYDYYWPAFAHLGEQAVLRKEIYCVGDELGANTDNLVFGYQERWAEYRYFPSKITGYFRSGIAGTLDPWHLAQEFSSAPVLGDTFIQENPPMDRVLSAGEEAENQQFLLDTLFDARFVRLMPTYSVPGLGSRF